MCNEMISDPILAAAHALHWYSTIERIGDNRETLEIEAEWKIGMLKAQIPGPYSHSLCQYGCNGQQPFTHVVVTEFGFQRNTLRAQIRRRFLDRLRIG